MRQNDSITAALIAAQEDERGRLARDLHDGVVQQVIALLQRVYVLERLLERGDVGEGVERAKAMRLMLVELVGDLRAVIGDLRPPALEELGLLRAVAMLVKQSDDEQPAVTLRVEGAERRIAPGHELAVFRIVQEAWSNILRHAHARQVAITFRYSSDRLVVTVCDDGNGFVSLPGSQAPEGHWGLRGMRERAKLIGGTLEVLSAAGCGTRLALQIPLPAPVEQLPYPQRLLRGPVRRTKRAAHQTPQPA